MPEGHRRELLAALRSFVGSVQQLAGVRRVAVLGSIITDKADPKDIDVLVVVSDDTDLSPLAAAARRLQGHAQSFNRGADVFLAESAARTSVEHVIGGTAGLVCVDPAMLFIAVDGLICMTISQRFGLIVPRS